MLISDEINFNLKMKVAEKPWQRKGSCSSTHAQTEGSISARGNMKRVGRGDVKPDMKNFIYF